MCTLQQIETLTIGGKNWPSVPAVEGCVHQAFSYLLSPMRLCESVNRNVRLIKGKPEQGRMNAQRYQQIKSRISPRQMQKHQLPLKSFTIDITKTKRSEQLNPQVRKRASSLMSKNDKTSLRTKKTNATRYSLNPELAKCSNNASLEIRVSRLGVRMPTFELESTEYVRQTRKISSSYQSRNQDNGSLKAQTLRARQRYQARNFRSLVSDDIRPWDHHRTEEAQSLF